MAAIINTQYEGHYKGRYKGNQTALGASIGVSQSQMSNYLRGARALDVDQLQDLCDELGLDIAVVVTAAAKRD